jgi:hypothetical protein
MSLIAELKRRNVIRMGGLYLVTVAKPTAWPRWMRDRPVRSWWPYSPPTVCAVRRFDLDATPNFKARLAESGLRWPPAVALKVPPRVRTSSP